MVELSLRQLELVASYEHDGRVLSRDSWCSKFLKPWSMSGPWRRSLLGYFGRQKKILDDVVHQGAFEIFGHSIDAFQIVKLE